MEHAIVTPHLTLVEPIANEPPVEMELKILVKNVTLVHGTEMFQPLHADLTASFLVVEIELLIPKSNVTMETLSMVMDVLLHA